MIRYIILAGMLSATGVVVSGEVVLNPKNPIVGIDYERATALSALSTLLGSNEGATAAQIKYFYEKIQKKEAIHVDDPIAKYVLLLKYAIPLMCSDLDVDKKRANNFLDHAINGIASSSLSKEINTDLDYLKRSNSIDLPTSIYPVLGVSLLSCQSEKKRAVKESDKNAGNVDEDHFVDTDVAERVKSVFGQTMVNDQSALSKEFSEKAMRQFNMTTHQAANDKNKGLQEIKKNGFLEVDDDMVVDIEDVFNKSKNKLKSLEELGGKITFNPLGINKDSYVFLGASTAGVFGDSGYSAINSIYNTSLGKMAVTEEDLIASNAVVSLEPEFLTEKVGDNPASLIVSKGRETGVFKTEIFWVDKTKNKSYTIEVNKNLNDESLKKERGELMMSLEQSFTTPH